MHIDARPLQQRCSSTMDCVSTVGGGNDVRVLNIDLASMTTSGRIHSAEGVTPFIKLELHSSIHARFP